MKIKDSILEEKSQIIYKLSVGSGRYVKSNMPVALAANIVQKAGDIQIVDDPGFEVQINKRHRFPKDIFEDIPAASSKDTPEQPEAKPAKKA